MTAAVHPHPALIEAILAEPARDVITLDGMLRRFPADEMDAALDDVTADPDLRRVRMAMKDR